MSEIKYNSNVEINFEKKVSWIEESKLKNIVKTLMNLTNIKNKTISILLCSNNTIHQLNKDYRAKDSPTDVLSFVYEDDTEILGDIAISLDKVEEQALKYDCTIEHELKRLLIHGILHIIGYDHEKDMAEEKLMFEKQDELMEHIKNAELS
jgi:probable rRNA maturation factor